MNMPEAFAELRLKLPHVKFSELASIGPVNAYGLVMDGPGFHVVLSGWESPQCVKLRAFGVCQLLRQ